MFRIVYRGELKMSFVLAELVTSKLEELKAGEGGRNKPGIPFQKTLGSPASKGFPPLYIPFATLSYL